MDEARTNRMKRRSQNKWQNLGRWMHSKCVKEYRKHLRQWQKRQLQQERRRRKVEARGVRLDKYLKEDRGLFKTKVITFLNSRDTLSEKDPDLVAAAQNFLIASGVVAEVHHRRVVVVDRVTRGQAAIAVVPRPAPAPRPIFADDSSSSDTSDDSDEEV